MVIKLGFNLPVKGAFQMNLIARIVYIYMNSMARIVYIYTEIPEIIASLKINANLQNSRVSIKDKVYQYMITTKCLKVETIIMCLKKELQSSH